MLGENRTKSCHTPEYDFLLGAGSQRRLCHSPRHTHESVVRHARCLVPKNVAEIDQSGDTAFADSRRQSHNSQILSEIPPPELGSGISPLQMSLILDCKLVKK